MIVRDEEEFLDACLESAKGVADEIVVLDTGSVDRTAEIARSHGARVYSHPWRDSYSEARNAGIDLATGDWILILDADERLDESAKPIIRGAVLDPRCAAYEFCQRNYYADDGSDALAGAGFEIPPQQGVEDGSDVIVNPTCRLWINRPEHRYQGRVHENPAPSIARNGGKIARIEAIIHHYGNQPSVLARRDKCRRYIELLEAELRDNPNNPAKLHDIAISHYVGGRHADALPYLQRAAGLVEPESVLGGLVFSTLVGALYHLGRFDEAAKTLDRALSLGARHPEIHYTGGQALMNLDRFEDAALQFQNAIDMGGTADWTGDAAVWGHKAHEAIAICYLRLGRWSDAAQHGIEALQATPDRPETRAIVAEACFNLGDALYEAADYSAAAEVYSTALGFARDHAPGFFALGNCYFRLGASESAILAYRKAIELDPDYAEAHNNLSVAEEAITRAA